MKMYDAVLQKAKSYEEKNGIYYTTTNGKMFKFLTIFACVPFLYMLLMNLVYLGSVALIYLAKDNTKNATSSFFIVLILSLALIVGAVLFLKKFRITGVLIELVSLPLLLIAFGYYLKEPVVFSFKAAFYYRHFVPILLLFILLIIMLVITVKERIRIKQSYDRVYQNIYKEYQSLNPDSLNDEDWEEFIKNYEA